MATQESQRRKPNPEPYPPVITPETQKCFPGLFVAVTHDVCREVRASAPTRRELFAIMRQQEIDFNTVTISYVD